MKRTRRIFSDDEKDFIKQNIGRMTYQQIGDHLGRSWKSIKTYAYKSGLNETLEFLRMHHPRTEVTMSEVKKVKEMMSISSYSLAKEMGRSESTIDRIKKRLSTKTSI